MLRDRRPGPHRRRCRSGCANWSSRAETSRANAPAAQVESVVVNDGSAQRSMVNSLTVTFDRVVTLDPGAFELRRQDGTSVGAERRHLRGRRPDRGGAHLRRAGDRRRLAGGRQLHADDPRRPRPRPARPGTRRRRRRHGGRRPRATPSSGCSATATATATWTCTTWGGSSAPSAAGAGDPHYLAYFDVNGDDRVGLIDLVAFARRLGTQLEPVGEPAAGDSPVRQQQQCLSTKNRGIGTILNDD